MDTHDYYTAAALLPRLLGFIYFFVFFPFLFQMKGLYGKEGIQPIATYLEYIKYRLGRRRFRYIPSIFWFGASDRAQMGLIGAGMFLSILLMLNVYPPLMLLSLYILHLSLLSAGQDFMSFGWEQFLLEINVNTILLTLTSPPNPIVWISLNLLLFRFHFQAGVSKIFSRDVNWRNLTAIWYHYQSQPLPNTQAWYVYKLPLWFHKASTAMMFFVELVVPFFIFAPDDFRFITFILLVGLQLNIWFTGNFSYLNYMTVVLCIVLVSDTWFKTLIGWSIPAPEPSSIIVDSIVTVLGACLLFLQVISLWNYFMPVSTFRKILDWVYSFHIANRYGIFAVMTTKRYEIVVEGSDDGVNWKEYLFQYKPSELDRRPRRISPYQPRLDWQAWFLPFTDYYSEPWFQNFLVRLLQGSPYVLKLLRHNPFPEKPPRFIRALAYDYIFSTAEEKKKSGVWWTREYVGFYSPTLSLKEPSHVSESRVMDEV